jgi:hypothetical protein
MSFCGDLLTCTLQEVLLYAFLPYLVLCDTAVNIVSEGVNLPSMEQGPEQVNIHKVPFSMFVLYRFSL